MRFRDLVFTGLAKVINRMSKKRYLVAFGAEGRLIWRFERGETKGDATIKARRKYWNKFCMRILFDSEYRRQEG
jgi:hypothetical protein